MSGPNLRGSFDIEAKLLASVHETRIQNGTTIAAVLDDPLASSCLLIILPHLYFIFGSGKTASVTFFFFLALYVCILFWLERQGLSLTP